MPAMAVAGVTASSDEHLVATLGEAVALRYDDRVASTRMSDQIGSFAHQVSIDFEELAWLRGLSSHIEHCDVRRGTAAVAADIVESLPDLLECESVAVFGDINASEATELITSSRPGSLPPTVEQCRWILDNYGHPAGGFPLVANHLADEYPQECPFAISSLLLLPIRRKTYHYGWLMACNRITPELELRGGVVALGADEFGTIEAGLMQSAAVLLSMRAWNQRLFQENEELLVGTVKSLARALEVRDAYTSGHSDRVAAIGRILAHEAGMSADACDRLHLTGLLHDIGKVGVPDHVLNKPGRLTADEYSIIKEHVTIGYGILKHIPSLKNALPGVLHHHEAYDGQGYPDGLSGNDIPLDARILAVADAYDAMTSCRPYRRGLPHERAVQILQEESGKQFDSAIVSGFMNRLDDIRAVCDADDGPDIDQHLVGIRSHRDGEQ